MRGSFLLEKQTEFIFLVFKVKQDEDSQDWHLVCQPEKYWYYQMHTPVSSAYICRPISGQIINIAAEEYGSQDSALRDPCFNFEKGGSHIINSNSLYSAF